MATSTSDLPGAAGTRGEVIEIEDNDTSDESAPGSSDESDQTAGSAASPIQQQPAGHTLRKAAGKKPAASTEQDPPRKRRLISGGKKKTKPSASAAAARMPQQPSSPPSAARGSSARPAKRRSPASDHGMSEAGTGKTTVAKSKSHSQSRTSTARRSQQLSLESGFLQDVESWQEADVSKDFVVVLDKTDDEAGADSEDEMDEMDDLDSGGERDAARSAAATRGESVAARASEMAELPAGKAEIKKNDATATHEGATEDEMAVGEVDEEVAGVAATAAARNSSSVTVAVSRAQGSRAVTAPVSCAQDCLLDDDTTDLAPSAAADQRAQVQGQAPTDGPQAFIKPAASLENDATPVTSLLQGVRVASRSLFASAAKAKKYGFVKHSWKAVVTMHGG